MNNEKPSTGDIPERIPLRFELHYEVDDLGENYRVWEEQFREPVGIGGDLDHLQRQMSS